MHLTDESTLQPNITWQQLAIRTLLSPRSPLVLSFLSFFFLLYIPLPSQTRHQFTMPLCSLPTEIRDMIWNLVASNQGERKIELFFSSKRSNVLKASSPPPQILYICQDSRRIGLCSYQKFKHVNAYINFDIDRISLPARSFSWASPLACRTDITYPRELKHVPRVHHDFVLSARGNNKFTKYDMNEEILLWHNQFMRFIVSKFPRNLYLG